MRLGRSTTHLTWNWAMNQKNQSWIFRTLKSVKNAIVTRTPDELAACESCGKLECSNGKWYKCEHRLEVKKTLNSKTIQKNN